MRDSGTHILYIQEHVHSFPIIYVCFLSIYSNSYWPTYWEIILTALSSHGWKDGIVTNMPENVTFQGKKKNKYISAILQKSHFKK